MKWVIFFLFMMGLLFSFGCSQEIRPVAWFLTDTDASSTDAQYSARIGAEIDRTEVGFASNYVADVTQNYGVYALHFILEDPNGMPLLKRVYVGGQVTVDLDEDGGMYGPLLGTVENVLGIDWVVETRYVRYDREIEAVLGDNEDEFLILVGPRMRF